MSNPLERYQQLNLNGSLEKIHTYPVACEELSFFLRLVYNKTPKSVQNLVFRDTVTAFRLLPQMQSTSATSAAHQLVRSAEAALPRQKKNLAMTEFKQAKVAQKRCNKVCREELDDFRLSGSLQLPRDVLVHIFSFLDLRSLVTAGLVSWSWNLASMDNQLWHLQHSMLFDHLDPKNKVTIDPRDIKDGEKASGIEGDDLANIDWRLAFRIAYLGSSSKSLRYHRGYCSYCKTVVWHRSMKCPTENHRIELMSPKQVVDYVLNSSWTEDSSSESESESDGATASGLWAYPSWTDK